MFSHSVFYGHLSENNMKSVFLDVSDYSAKGLNSLALRIIEKKKSLVLSGSAPISGENH